MDDENKGKRTTLSAANALHRRPAAPQSRRCVGSKFVHEWDFWNRGPGENSGTEDLRSVLSRLCDALHERGLLRGLVAEVPGLSEFNYTDLKAREEAVRLWGAVSRDQDREEAVIEGLRRRGPACEYYR